jgi:hypothetical protein
MAMDENKPAGEGSVKVPARYLPARWRNTTAVDADGMIGVGFEVDGAVVRLALSAACARHLAETLSDYLSRSHSDKSVGG